RIAIRKTSGTRHTTSMSRRSIAIYAAATFNSSNETPTSCAYSKPAARYVMCGGAASSTLLDPSFSHAIVAGLPGALALLDQLRLGDLLRSGFRESIEEGE